jgi:hypothetical protein
VSFRRARPFGILIFLLLIGCQPKFSGELQVDGAAFTPAECRSGLALGFSGVQFADAGGRRLRLIANADGTTNAALFAPNAPRGDNLGACGTLVMHAQSSRVNSITNQMGTADLSCQAVGHKVSGKLAFENCH